MLAATVAGAGGCVTVAYDGPRLPASEVATIEAGEVHIDQIDGRDVRDKSQKFEVRPGDHILAVRLQARRGYYFVTKYFSSRDAMWFCVRALPKHYYVLGAQVGATWWAPIIYDGSSDVTVLSCSPDSVGGAPTPLIMPGGG